MPEVSIIMPVKNAGKYLQECLSSISEQTYTSWELVVVDDQSTDNTLQILEEAARVDKRIRIFKNPGHGIIPALEMAFNQTKGTYITRMDGDDMMPKNRLALMVKALSTAPAKSIVTGMVQYFGEAEVSTGYKQYETWLNTRIQRNDHWKWVYRECVIASPNWMARKAELEAIEAFPHSKYPEDYHLVLKWHQHGFKILPIAEITLSWREHPERTSRNSDHYQQEAFFRIKLKFFLQNKSTILPLALWGTGQKGRLSAKLLEEAGVSFDWMDLHPEKYPKGILGRTIKHFSTIESEEKYQLLIAVYPEGKAMDQLLKYLEHQGYEMGRSFRIL